MSKKTEAGSAATVPTRTYAQQLLGGRDAAVVLLVGEAGVGKSVENIYSWAGCGLFVAQPNALAGQTSVVGTDISSRTVQLGRMEQVPDIIRAAGAAGYAAVVIDDASLLMKNTIALTRDRFKTVSKSGGEGYDYGMYTFWSGVLQDVAYTARWAGVHVILNAHVQPAYTDKATGEFFKAGPDFDWKKLVRVMPHTADLVLQAVTRPPSAPEWDTRADCDRNDPSVMMKDRFTVMPARGGPLNTAEVLRAAGYNIPRPSGLEWMNDVAEWVATEIAAGKPEADVTKAARAQLDGKVHPFHTRWALRDGVHRGRLRKHAATSVLAGF